MEFLSNYNNSGSSGPVPMPPASNTNPATPPVNTMSSKKIALCLGINDYPGSGNDLRGCVNDAVEWGNLLKSKFGFEVTTLTNEKVSYNDVKAKLRELVAKADSETHVVVTYSGHGTHVPDRSGDEPDGRDEAICLYDVVMTDDELREIFGQLNPNAKLTYISDSCHSGSISRSFLSTISDDFYAKPKYLPNADERSSDASTYVKAGPSEETMNEVVITGCLPTEYSYDAHFDGRYMGAMSYNALKILNANPNVTYTEFYNQLKGLLPSSRYPQTPQLEGKAANKNKKMFS